MPITITIHGEDAAWAIDELKILASVLLDSVVPLSPAWPELSAAPGNTAASTAKPATAAVEAAPPPPPPHTADTAEAGPQQDANGVAFDPALHTGTLKKDGTWRMKKGAADAEAAPPPPPPAPVDEDEFAAFASAEAAPAAPVARNWTDADLSKLCNQGASKDGNPDRVKAIIAKYVPENEVSHSRNIPAAVRENFAQEVESTIGIQYAG